MIKFVAAIPSRHNRNLDRCRQLIREAARIGCAGVTFALFRVDQIFATQILRVSPAHRLQRRWELPLHWVPELSRHARDHGLKFGVTPFSLETVTAVQTQVDFLKVSSHELPWLDLVHRCADTDLPLLIGTGMADAGETWTAVETAQEAGCTDLTLLHTVCYEPTPEEACNLAAIGTLRELLVREFAPLYPDSELKAGWSDHSISAGVIARAVNHWGCDLIEFPLDLDDRDPDSGASPCWLPDQIAEVIAGGYLPVRRECDGTGRITPDQIELGERSWRADPGDGLRPNLGLRQIWPAAQPEGTRSGPDVYLVSDGPGLDRISRCLALAEHLRDDHDADVLFLIRGKPYQARFLERCGFNWARFDGTENLVNQITFLNNLTAAGGPPVCVLDLPEPVAELTTELRRAGMVTVLIDQPAGSKTDLGLVPRCGWQPVADPAQTVGGTEYVLIRDDVVFLRTHREESAAGAYPRVVVNFGAVDNNGLTSRLVSALHTVIPHGDVQVVVHPATDPDNVISPLLTNTYDDFEIINTDDDAGLVLAGADLVVTACYTIATESLCLGVPVLMMANDNEAAAYVAQLAEGGAVVDLGCQEDVGDDELMAILSRLFGDAERLSGLRFHARTLADGPLDGHGAMRAAGRVMQAVRERRDAAK